MPRLEISIALCTYNGEAFLSQQLKSIADQSLLPDEVVVIDDDSKDNCVRIVNEYSLNVPFRVRLERNLENMGFIRNYEKAINLCSGDVIFLADQDDYWAPEKIESYMAVFNQFSDVAMVFGDADIVDANLKPIGKTLWEMHQLSSKRQKAINSGRALETFLQKEMVTGSTLAFRSSYLRMIMPIPDSWVHDAWVSLVLSALSQIRCVPRPLIKYRVHASNALGINKSSAISKIRKTIKSSPCEVYELVRRYELALDRLNALIDVSDAAKEKLCQKKMHLVHRASLAKNRITRAKQIARELCRGRYRLYSNGWRTAVVDLLKK
jgi:glycosyltransferase involved in cell wall biosynthesis